MAISISVAVIMMDGDNCDSRASSEYNGGDLCSGGLSGSGGGDSNAVRRSCHGGSHDRSGDDDTGDTSRERE